MDETPDCQWVNPLLAELATGAATGHERARALRHLAGCSNCRQDLAALARVADDLLLLIPEQEPPPGFETAVAQRIASLTGAVPGARPVRRGTRLARSVRRWAGTVPHRIPTPTAIRLVAAAAVLVLVAIGGAAAAYWHAASDRQLADQYRHTIAVAGSQYPTATPVTAADGSTAGHLFLYQGSPPWVMVALTDAPKPGSYTMIVLDTNGTTYTAGVCAVTGRAGTAGYPLTIPVAQIAAIKLTTPGIVLTADPS